MRLWVASLILAGSLGSLLPAESATNRSYLVKMLPPSGSAGQRVTLTCGFHGGSCGSGSGDFLDWDNTGSYKVSFRGFFTRSGGSYETNRLVGKRRFVEGGPQRCEIQEVRIVEKANNKIWGVMRFLHATMNSTSDFPIATSGDGVYNAKYIGDITNDAGCGLWSGTHVHSGYVSGGAASRSRNTSRFPSGDYCDPPRVSCKTFTNDSSTNWTHKFAWTGP